MGMNPLAYFFLRDKYQIFEHTHIFRYWLQYQYSYIIYLDEKYFSYSRSAKCPMKKI